MVTLCMILFFPAMALLGELVIQLLYGGRGKKAFYAEDRCLTGGILLIGLAEAAHLGALVCGRSVSVAERLLLLLIGISLLVAAVFLTVRYFAAGKNNIKKEKFALTEWAGGLKNGERLLLCILAAVILWQMSRILFGTSVYVKQDITLETVTSFLHTGKMYEVNPLTGAVYRQGLPDRLKILCLPTLYSAAAGFLKCPAQQLVWHVVPFPVLIMSYLAYGSLSRVFFPENRLLRLLFLVLTSLIFCVGDAMYGLEGFGLLHGGFQGTTIRGAILLPYLFGLCLRKKYKLAVTAALAEACIVWTLYGMGMGILTILFVFSGQKVYERIVARKEGQK